MTMSKEIITSHKNKSIIMCGLNESGYSDKNTVMEEVEGRIIPVPNDSDSFINEIMKHPDAHVLIDMLIGEKDAVSDETETDVNGDGEVNNRDALLLFRRAAGLA